MKLYIFLSIFVILVKTSKIQICIYLLLFVFNSFKVVGVTRKVSIVAGHMNSLHFFVFVLNIWLYVLTFHEEFIGLFLTF